MSQLERNKDCSNIVKASPFRFPTKRVGLDFAGLEAVTRLPVAQRKGPYMPRPIHPNNMVQSNFSYLLFLRSLLVPSKARSP